MRALDGLSFIVVGVLAAAVALTGCSRPQDPTSAPEPAVAPAAPVPQPVPPADIPAESSLSIKRGIATLTQDRMTFQACGEKAELWLLDQTDGVLKQAFAADVQSGSPLKLYVEAYGERTPTAQDIPEARAYGGTFVLEEVLYAAMQAETKGCDAPAPDYVVIARGNEPFWAVEVKEEQVVWRQPDVADMPLGPPQTQDAEGAVHFRAGASGHQMELMIESQQCRDSMSGELFAYSAKAVLDGKQFSGCARVGE